MKKLNTLEGDTPEHKNKVKRCLRDLKEAIDPLTLDIDQQSVAESLAESMAESLTDTQIQ